MKGFRIRVHVSNPPRKQNVHARKLRERSASRPSRESSGETIQIEMCVVKYDKYACARSLTGNFRRKQPRKVSRNKGRRESQHCARERIAKAVAKAYKDWNQIAARFSTLLI